MTLTATQAAQIAAGWSPNIPTPLWLTDKSYGIGDCVIHSNSMWIALAANQGSEPPSADWAVVVDSIGTGVSSIIAGDGISVDAATGDVTVTNEGVTSLAAGAGLAVDVSTGDVTVSVDGGVASGTFISADGSPKTITVTNGIITDIT